MEIFVLGVVDQSGIPGVFGDGWQVPDREVILVEVRSYVDWTRHTRYASAFAELVGDFCDTNRRTLMVRPWLFSNGKIVDWKSTIPYPNRPTRNEAGLYVVEGYIYVRNGRQLSLREHLRDDPTQKFYDEFDLKKDPRDICVYVAGSTPSSGFHYFKSNETRISRDKVAAALLRDL